MGDAMTMTVKPVLGPIRADEDEHAETAIAVASPQQREAIVERLCEAVLSESDGPRAADPVARQNA